MTESHEQASPFYLINCFVRGELTEQDGEILLHYIEKNPRLISILYDNVMMDMWLDNLFTTDRNACEVVVEPEIEDMVGRNLNGQNTAHCMAPHAKALLDMTPEEESDFWSEATAVQTLRPPEPIDEKLYTRLCQYERLQLRVVPSQKETRRTWNLSDFVFVGCMMLAMILGIGLYLQDRSIRQNHHTAENAEEFVPIARVAELINPVWTDKAIQYRRGQKIDVGELNLKSGHAKIEFGNGTVVLLEGPTQFVINNGLVTFCTQGRINATVSPGAAGFTVLTPYGSVVDHGTEFFIEVDQKRFEVETNKGLVEVVTAGTSPVLLPVGKAILISRGKPQQTYQIKSPRFTTLGTFDKTLTKYVTQLKEEKKKNDLVLDTNPNLLVRFDAANRKGNIIPNTSIAGQKLCAELNVTGLSTEEGRWSGTTAIGFTNRTDHGTFNLDGTYRRLAITIHVRFDHLGMQNNALCIGRDFQKVPGTFFWQISRSGELMFFVTDRNGRTEEYLSLPVVTVHDTGSWFDLSVVADVDKGEISQYVNGKPVSKATWKNAIPLAPGDCILGNVPEHFTFGKSNRFDGAMDEIQISTEIPEKK